jgi:hypothetical protein
VIADPPLLVGGVNIGVSLLSPEVTDVSVGAEAFFVGVPLTTALTRPSILELPLVVIVRAYILYIVPLTSAGLPAEVCVAIILLAGTLTQLTLSVLYCLPVGVPPPVFTLSTIVNVKLASPALKDNDGAAAFVTGIAYITVEAVPGALAVLTALTCTLYPVPYVKEEMVPVMVVTGPATAEVVDNVSQVGVAGMVALAQYSYLEITAVFAVSTSNLTTSIGCCQLEVRRCR